MRAWIVAVLMLAGCTSSEVSDPSPTMTDGPNGTSSNETLPASAAAAMTQHGCSSFYSMHSVAPDWAAARLPEGFSAVPRDANGVYFASKSWRCETTQLDNQTYTDVGVVLYYIGVSPPEAYAHEDVVFYWLPLQMLAEAPLADYFAAQGFPATEPVRATFERPLPQGEVDAWRAAAESRSGEHVDILVEIDEKSPSEDFLIRYFAGDATGIVGWVDITVHEHTQGQGEALFDSDAPDGPFLLADPGAGRFQGWEGGELSYTWVAGKPTLLALKAP